MYGLGVGDEVHLNFEYPYRLSNAFPVREQRANEATAKRRNRRLRWALWECWNKAVQECLAEVEDEDQLVQLVERCAKLKQQLQAEVDEAATAEDGQASEAEEEVYTEEAEV